MPSILVIEDDNVMRAILQVILQKQGYVVTIAQNDQQAFTLLNQERFNLIITDLMLPFMGGLELLRKLKSNEAHKHIPVIIISTDPQEETVREAFELGADDFLRKPCAPGDLISRVRRLLTNQTIPL